MKPNAYITVGCSGSGKTTFLKKFYEKLEEPKAFISPDEIREQLSGDMADQSQNEQVFRVVKQKLRMAQTMKINVCFDATNINANARKLFLDFCFNLHYFVFTTPFDVCVEQNNKRDRKVPLEVIERQHSRFSIPNQKENPNIKSVTII